MSVSIDIVPDPAAACARLLVDLAGRGAHIALAGGSTPKQAYAEAATLPGDWSGAHLWFSDDRCVAPTDERSNYLMARTELLDPLAATGQHPTVHRIRGELGPEDAADAYEQELRAAGPPRFELILLGIGPDGHTASLFPGKPALDVGGRLVVPVPEAGLEPFVPRVTFSFDALATADRIVFLIAGASKEAIVTRVFGDPALGGDTPLPSQMLIRRAADRITLLTDAAAAAGL